MTQEKKPGLIERFRNSPDFRYILLYGLIGGVAAIIDFSIFTLCYHTLPLDDSIRKVISNVISIHCGFVFAFSMNTAFNFKKRDKIFRRLLSYYGIALVGLGLSSLILQYGTPLADFLLAGIGTHSLHISAVKIFAMGVVSAAQYVLNRLITYRF